MPAKRIYLLVEVSTSLVDIYIYFKYRRTLGYNSLDYIRKSQELGTVGHISFGSFQRGNEHKVTFPPQIHDMSTISLYGQAGLRYNTTCTAG